MNNVQSTVERIKKKQEEFQRVRLKNLIKETKREFGEYIRNLPCGNKCKYMTGVSEIINLCNNTLFTCEFKGEVYKSFTKNPKRECLRQRILRFERILEH